MEELGIFSLPDAQQIHRACIGGKLVEKKEHSRPSVGGGGGQMMIAKLTMSFSTGTATDSWIYSFDGMATTYVELATLYDPLRVYRSLGNGDWLYCFKQAGKYYALPGDCSGNSPFIDTPPASGPPGEPV